MFNPYLFHGRTQRSLHQLNRHWYVHQRKVCSQDHEEVEKHQQPKKCQNSEVILYKLHFSSLLDFEWDGVNIWKVLDWWNFFLLWLGRNGLSWVGGIYNKVSWLMNFLREAPPPFLPHHLFTYFSSPSVQKVNYQFLSGKHPANHSISDFWLVCLLAASPFYPPFTFSYPFGKALLTVNK